MNNTDITLYHKTFDDINKLETWEKQYFPYVWWYGGKSASINEGIEDSKNLDVRIWYKTNTNLDASQISLGDIVIKGNQDNIETQQDLDGKEYYNIVGINDNNLGNSPHVHLKGQ